MPEQNAKERIAVYPGAFDPVTNGHLDVVCRALEIFDRIIVAVLENDTKKPLFSAKERVDLIKNAVNRGNRIEVESFSGLLVDYLKRKKAHFVIRGLRAVSDFDYEFQMAIANKKLSPDVETIFIMTDQQYLYLNSSLVKEFAKHGGSLDGLVPKNVAQALRKKLQ